MTNITIDTPQLRSRMFTLGLDVLLVTLFLPLIVPLTVCTIIWCWCATGKPFYLADRVGHKSEIFRVWKIRTMIQGSEKIAPGCGLIRQYRLDELPQLFQVYSGRLSLFTGFRPMTESDVESLRASGQDVDAVYALLRPSISGINAIRRTDQMRFVYEDGMETARQQQCLRATLPFYGRMVRRTIQFICRSENTDRNGIRLDAPEMRPVAPSEKAA